MRSAFLFSTLFICYINFFLQIVHFQFRVEITVPSAGLESKPVVFENAGEKMHMNVGFWLPFWSTEIDIIGEL